MTAASSRAGYVALSVLGLTILVGCNDDEKASTPARPTNAAALDPCNLVSVSEAEALLGGKVTGPERASGFGQFSQCQYMHTGERIADMSSLTIQLHPVDFPSMRKAYVDSGEKLEATSGVGEAAFWVPGHSMLFVQKGKLTAGFAVHRQDTDLFRASRQLAEKALPRVP